MSDKIALLKTKLQHYNNFVQLEVFPGGIVRANLIDKKGNSHCRIYTQEEIEKEINDGRTKNYSTKKKT